MNTKEMRLRMRPMLWRAEGRGGKNLGTKWLHKISESTNPEAHPIVGHLLCEQIRLLLAYASLCMICCLMPKAT